MTFLTTEKSTTKDVRNDINRKKMQHKAEELHSSFKRPRYSGKNRKGDASPAFSHGNASPGAGQRTPGGGVKKDLRRTVFIYGIPPKMSAAQVRNEAASQGGEIKGFHMEGDDDGPHRPSAVSVMAKKLGRTEQEIRKEGLKTAFVVMSSQGQATKLVKGRGRQDGTGNFRCIHKYDYMKSIRKSPSSRSAGGFTPRFSPKPTKVPGSAPLGPQRNRPFSNRSSFGGRRGSNAPSPHTGSPVFRELRPNLRANARFPKWSRPRSAPGPRPFMPRGKREDMSGLKLMPSTISESSRFTGSSTRILRRTSGGHRDRMAKGPMDSSTPGFNWSRAGQRTPIAKISENEEVWAVENIRGPGSLDIPSIRQDSSPLMQEEVVPEWQVVSDPESDNEFGLQISNRSEPVISSLTQSPMNSTSMSDNWGGWDFSGEDKESNCKDNNIWSSDMVTKGSGCEFQEWEIDLPSFFRADSY